MTNSRRKFLVGLGAAAITTAMSANPAAAVRRAKRRRPQLIRRPKVPTTPPIVGQPFTATAGQWRYATSVRHQWEVSA